MKNKEIDIERIGQFTTVKKPILMEERITRLTNKFPDSVQGESSAGIIEIAQKVNEIIDVLNILLEAIKKENYETK